MKILVYGLEQDLGELELPPPGLGQDLRELELPSPGLGQDLGELELPPPGLGRDPLEMKLSHHRLQQDLADLKLSSWSRVGSGGDEASSSQFGVECGQFGIPILCFRARYCLLLNSY